MTRTSLTRSCFLTNHINSCSSQPADIGNSDLEDLFVAQIPRITMAFESYGYLELTRTTLIFHW